PVLADALEDAGCTDAKLIRHLRSEGPHVRGCWALDSVLVGKCGARAARLPEGLGMGTWGPGNFENDRMSEHFHAVFSPLWEHVEKTMSDPAPLDPESDEADAVLANLEIIACLFEQMKRSPCEWPPAKTIAKWKRKFLASWDAGIDAMGPKPDYKRD